MQSRFLFFRCTNRLIKTFSDGPRNNKWAKWLEIASYVYDVTQR